MNIKFHKKFQKAYKKLSDKQKSKVKATVKVFTEDPFHKILDNHALSGNKKDLRSISVGADLRILFFEEGAYVTVVMLELGTHSQLY